MTSPVTRRGVFLDRDGVINDVVLLDGKPHPPDRPDAVRILPGVPEACGELKRAGFTLLVVTNQPDVARGTLSVEVLAAINDRIATLVPVDAIYVCTHDDQHGCTCRKPAPGMITRGAEEHSLNVRESFMVGDRWRDIEAGQRAGCWTVLINRGYLERPANQPDYTATSLPEAVGWILGQRSAREESAGVHG